jgi:stress response protein YsnF
MTAEQQKDMQDYHKWKAIAEEYREKIRQANANGNNGREMYGRLLDEAESTAQTCYELATDRGY